MSDGLLMNGYDLTKIVILSIGFMWLNPTLEPLFILIQFEIIIQQSAIAKNVCDIRLLGENNEVH